MSFSESSERVSGHGVGWAMGSKREIQSHMGLRVLGWGMPWEFWASCGDWYEQGWRHWWEQPEGSEAERGSQVGFVGRWEETVKVRSPLHSCWRWSGGLRRGSLPRAAGALGSLLLPGRNISQNTLHRTESKTTDMSMKENCPEIDSYIGYNLYIMNSALKTVEMKAYFPPQGQLNIFEKKQIQILPLDLILNEFR